MRSFASIGPNHGTAANTTRFYAKHDLVVPAGELLGGTFLVLFPFWASDKLARISAARNRSSTWRLPKLFPH